MILRAENRLILKLFFYETQPITLGDPMQHRNKNIDTEKQQ
jgi:hypothetical protein